jgi:hypothetical protein
MAEDIAFTHRFVAGPDTRRQMARAFVDHVQRMRRMRVIYLLCLSAFTVIMWTGLDDGLAPGARLSWSVAYALVPTLLAALLFAAAGYVSTLRGARMRLFPGAVIESGFGEDELVLRGPVSETRLSYRAVRSLVSRGEFVFLQQHGLAVVSIFPRALFPDEAIARIRTQAGTR